MNILLTNKNYGDFQASKKSSYHTKNFSEIHKVTENVDITVKQFSFPYPSDSKVDLERCIQELTKYTDNLKMISFHENSAKIIFSEIIDEPNSKIIKVNLSIERTQTLLKEFISQTKLNLSQIQNILFQSLNFLIFAQAHKYIYSDIRIDDFFIDSNGKLKFFEYCFPEINFNSSEMYYKTYEFYSAPEIIIKKQACKIKKEDMENSNSNPNEIVKLQIYSWGIFAYLLIGGQSQINNKETIDELKIYPEGYTNLFLSIDSLQIGFEKEQNDVSNIKSIIKSALDYTPDDRLDFYNLKKSSQISNINFVYFENKIEEYIKNLKTTPINLLMGKMEKNYDLKENSIEVFSTKLNDTRILDKGNNYVKTNKDIRSILIKEDPDEPKPQCFKKIKEPNLPTLFVNYIDQIKTGENFQRQPCINEPNYDQPSFEERNNIQSSGNRTGSVQTKNLLNIENKEETLDVNENDETTFNRLKRGTTIDYNKKTKNLHLKKQNL